MIVLPRTPEEWQTLAGFLKRHAGVHPSADSRFIGWLDEDKKLVIVVGFNGFMGKVAQIHLAFTDGWHFSPRAMLREAFRYAFDTAKLEMLIGVVNSKNERAMRMDLHLGFHELFRLPKMHDDGGDIVVLGMKKGECRYLDSEVITAESA